MISITTPQPPRLLEQVRRAVRYRHFSLSTERAYVHWIRAFVKFHGAKAHPREMGAAQVEAFLSDLVSTRNVSASTHRQAHGRLIVSCKLKDIISVQAGFTLNAPNVF
jgi:hypothetical protein